MVGEGGEEQCKCQITHPLTVRQSLSRMSWAREVTSSVVSVPSAPWTSTGVPAHKVLQKYSVVWTSTGVPAHKVFQKYSVVWTSHACTQCYRNKVVWTSHACTQSVTEIKCDVD